MRMNDCLSKCLSNRTRDDSMAYRLFIRFLIANDAYGRFVAAFMQEEGIHHMVLPPRDYISGAFSWSRECRRMGETTLAFWIELSNRWKGCLVDNGFSIS